jgi:cytochrome c-type biogenesis protein
MIDFAGLLDQNSLASPLAFGLVALAGLAMGVAPSSLPLYSVVMGTVAAGAGPPSRAGRFAFSFPLGFVLGIAIVDAAAGALFAFVGMLVIEALVGSLALVNLLIALLLVVIGLALLRIIRIPGLRIEARPGLAASFGGAVALGVLFGLSTCPACTPMVLPVLGSAAATGNPLLGAALLFTFGLARGAPLIAAGAAAGAIKHVGKAAPWVRRIERIGGMLVLIAAAYFLYQSAVYAGLAPPLPSIDY